MNLFLVISVDL